MIITTSEPRIEVFANQKETRTDFLSRQKIQVQLQETRVSEVSGHDDVCDGGHDEFDLIGIRRAGEVRVNLFGVRRLVEGQEFLENEGRSGFIVGWIACIVGIIVF